MLITHWFWAKHPRAINRIRCPIVFYFVWGSRTKLQDATHFTLSKGMEDSHSGTLHPQECGGRSSTPQQTTFFLLTTAHEGRSCRKQDPNLPRFNDKSKKMFQFSSFSFYEWLSSRPFWEWKNDILKVIKFFLSHAPCGWPVYYKLRFSSANETLKGVNRIGARVFHAFLWSSFSHSNK